MPPPSDGNPRNQYKIVTLVGALVFAIMALLLYHFQEHSLVATCMNWLGNNADRCIAGKVKDAAEAIRVDPDFFRRTAEALEKHPPRYGFQYAVLGTVLGACIAFLLVYLMPAGTLQLSGTFEKFGGTVRASGVALVVLILALGGGALSHFTASTGERTVLNDTIFKTLTELNLLQARSYEKLNDKYAALVAAVRKQDDTFVHELIKNHYLRPTVASIKIRCDETSGSGSLQANPNPVVMRIPGFPVLSYDEQKLGMVIPIDTLFKTSQISLPVHVVPERDPDSNRELVRVEYKLEKDPVDAVPAGSAPSAMTNPRVAMRLNVITEINRTELNEYCDNLVEQADPVRYLTGAGGL